MSERSSNDEARRDPPALQQRVDAAVLALLWERLWPALWPALGVAGLFVALSLLDFWSLLPGWTHLALLLVFAVALLAAAGNGARSFALPRREEARRRLERKSELAHRPLTALRDRLVNDRGDAGARTLWRLHRARALALVHKLRVGLPEAGLARRDPWGLRALVVLALVAGAATAGPEGPTRLARAFAPDLSGAVPLAAELDAWIAPPEYTGLAPLMLDPAASGQIVRVPEGSTMLARVHGGRGAVLLRLDDDELAFEKVDRRSQQISHTLERGSRIEVAQGETVLGAWPLELMPDLAPAIDFAEVPTRTVRSALRVEYEAADDYGVVAVRLDIRRSGGDETLEIALPMPGRGLREVREAGFHDLTPHPWAGLPVTLELFAEDAKGQVGMSEIIEMVLPERIFNHPVARAIIEQRKLLTLDPSKRGRVARALDAISARPEHFFEDTVVYLSLRSARWRLVHDDEKSAIAEVQELLWDTALRIEDGNLSLAERDLRAAQQALMEALANGAPDAELERLMDALQEAMENFLQALAERALEQAERGELQELDRDTLTLESEDLRRLMEQARELARSGAREAARQLLSQLQEMLENLRAGLMLARPRDAEGNPRGALRDLGQLMRRQQRLLDETFRESRRGQGSRGSEPNRGDPTMAARQEALRRGLGELMRRLGEGQGQIPGALGRAERSMLEARRSLQQGRPGTAVGPQTNALEEMRAGAQAMIEQMLEQMGAQGEGRDGRGRFGPRNRDPLGRAFSSEERDGGITGGDVEIPDKAALERARELLGELYRRAGQPTRPKLELDYIDRLLRRF